MKTVKSVADLKVLALHRGAAVEGSDLRFNTSRDRISVLGARRPEIAPAPEPPAAPVPQLQLGPVLEAALAKSLAPKPKHFDLVIHRDEKGRAVRITATPIY
jgi:hypothetical protein